MGFSPWGLVVSIAVLAPNLLLVVLPPRTPLAAASVPAVLVWLERAGQAACLVVPAITLPSELSWGWSVPAGAALLLYWALWVRYLATGRTASALYRPAWRVPVPMAVLPVLVFLCAGLWLGNIVIVAAALVLGAGHIPASVIVAREVLGR